MSEPLVNRIAASGLITLKPEAWAPAGSPETIDLRDYLFMEAILKEKDFRASLANLDVGRLAGKPLCVFCSADAIIPNWAYMLVASRAAGHATEVFFGSPEAWRTRHILRHIETMDIEPYRDQRVVLKGCSDALPIGPEVYLALTNRLVPVVRSLMFGEPCSTVPVYKRSGPAG